MTFVQDKDYNFEKVNISCAFAAIKKLKPSQVNSSTLPVSISDIKKNPSFNTLNHHRTYDFWYWAVHNQFFLEKLEKLDNKKGISYNDLVALSQKTKNQYNSLNKELSFDINSVVTVNNCDALNNESYHSIP